ncbi:hypothetical protein G9A89_006206 [Geosiphon pyriformis]|nr:hypothetical protein G9A89_006206 [Geosiphon pyriformis]
MIHVHVYSGENFSFGFFATIPLSEEYETRKKGSILKLMGFGTLPRGILYGLFHCDIDGYY